MKEPSELTPNDIYAMPVREVSTDIGQYLVGCYFDHLDGSGIAQWEFHKIKKPSNRVEVRIVKHFDFDFRRFWRLATVWFDSKPIMIIQNAGREGDDHSKRFITDRQGFLEMCSHIRTLLDLELEHQEDVVAADAVLGRKLIDFYGNYLNGYFERYS